MTTMIDPSSDRRTCHAAPDRPRLSAQRKLLFAIVFLVVLLGGAEILCRLFGLGRSQQAAHYISEWHDTPDGRTFWVVRGSGHNSDGMRDREHSTAKPPDVYRVVCLGDSVTVGYDLQRSESYPAVLQTFFDQMKLPVGVEVFNIAVHGWSTLQESAAYKAIARGYQPDHVFLGFCLNDVAEMNNNLTEPPPAVLSWFMRHSAFVRWVVNAEGRQVHDAMELFEEPEPPAVEQGWFLVFEDLKRLQEETRADGCDFSVIIFPFRFQLGENAPEPRAQRRIFEFCFANGIPCLDLLPALRPMGPEALIDESHLSPQAAQIVARELIRWGQTGCVACGFDLAGVEGDACPRCNMAIERR